MKEFTIDELNAALFDFEYLMGRCLSPFLLLKETGKTIKEDLFLKGDRVQVGIESKYLTPEAISTINTYRADRIDNDRGFTYEVNGVPVEVTIIKRKYKFFAHPDTVFYWGEGYLVPNPFDKYYKSRFIIQ